MNQAKLFHVAFLFLSAIGVFGAADLEAQSSEITLYAGGFFGERFISTPDVLFPRVEAVFDDDVTGGFRYAYFFTSRLAAEFGVGFTPASILTKARVSGGTNAAAVVGVDTYVVHGNLTAHLLQGPIIPFVTGGVGAVHFDFATNSFGFLTPSETDFALNAGGGLKIPVRNQVAIRLDGRVYWVDSEFADETSTFGEVTGGVSILFDF